MDNFRARLRFSHRARDFTPAARQVLRQQESVPILDRIENDLAELTERILPKSALGKAVNYARNQWAALRRYSTDGTDHVSQRQLARVPAEGDAARLVTRGARIAVGRFRASWWH